MELVSNRHLSSISCMKCSYVGSKYMHFVTANSSYTEYRQTVCHRLHELHEIVASSFDDIHARCLPFPDKGANVEEMID
jgi:hypothetical protein